MSKVIVILYHTAGITLIRARRIHLTAPPTFIKGAVLNVPPGNSSEIAPAMSAELSYVQLKAANEARVSVSGQASLSVE